MPQMMSWTTFLPITDLLSAVEGSLVSKCRRIRLRMVLEIHENRNQELMTTASLTMLTLRFSWSMNL